MCVLKGTGTHDVVVDLPPSAAGRHHAVAGLLEELLVVADTRGGY